MSHQVAFVAESFIACWTVVVLLSRSSGDIIRIVIDVLVSLKQLLLTEGLVTELTFERLLIGVNEHVGLEVTSRN